MIVRQRGSPEGGGTACSRVSNADVVARSRLGGVSPLIQGVTDRAPPANGVVRVPAVDGTGATTKSSGNINRDAAAYAASKRLRVVVRAERVERHEVRRPPAHRGDPVVGAEPDGQVLDPVDLGRPAVPDRGQDVAVGHVGRGLAHPLTQARAGPAAREVYLSLWTRTPCGVRRLGAPSPLMPARGICHDLARPCPDDPDAAARAARADGADPLPPAPGRTAEHGGALRGEGQPAPRAARARWWRRGRASTWPARPRYGRASTPAPAPADLVYSNPIKLRADIVSAAELGVRLFVVDSPEETRKVAEAAPGTAVLCRIVTSGSGSDWPLSRKYGCSTSEAVEVLRLAAALGLDAAGVSFHVGSQQRDPSAWDAPIEASSRVFAALRQAGLRPWLLDLGGGFPAALEGGAPALDAYGAAIRRSLRKRFGSRRPRTIIEPGRSIVADVGATGDVRRGRGAPRRHPVGLPRRRGVHRAGRDPRRGDPLPARDRRRRTDRSVRARRADVRQRRRAVREAARAPAARRSPRATGSCSTSAGAYTTCYSTVGFNGFAPLPTELVLGLVPA